MLLRIKLTDIVYYLPQGSRLIQTYKIILQMYMYMYVR